MKHNHPYKEPWFWLCYERGIHPRLATADDVFGKWDPQMQDADRRRVILESEIFVPIDEQGENVNHPLDSGTALYDVMSNGDIPDLEGVIEVAGLTNREAEVVNCIMDGTPMGYGYADRIASRLGLSARAVQSAWFRAQEKLRSKWASDFE